MPEEYDYARSRTTGWRLSLARVLMDVASATRWWKVIPAKHPARIYLDGFFGGMRVQIEESITAPSHRYRKWVWITTGVLAWMVFNAAAHRIGLNPIEGLFDRM